MTDVIRTAEAMPCARCDYRWAQQASPERGHCYMFKEQPEGTFCGQYRPGVGLLPHAASEERYRQIMSEWGVGRLAPK